MFLIFGKLLFSKGVKPKTFPWVALWETNPYNQIFFYITTTQNIIDKMRNECFHICCAY